MNAVIIEDELPAARKLERLLKEVRPDIQVLTILESVKSAVEWFGSKPNPDIIFSDIQLSDDLSFEIFKQIEISVPIIFTTAYDEYAINAFNHFSIDYLLKPIRPEHLKRAISKIDKLSNFNTGIDFNSLVESISKREYKKRVLVYAGENIISLPINRISYFFCEDGISFIKTTGNKQFIVNESINELETECDPLLFFRANRQFLVSINSVQKVSPYFNQRLKLYLNPEPSTEVFVSKLKATSFKNWLNK